MSDPITKRTTTVVTVGKPSADHPPDDGWETVEVHFVGFEDLPSGRNESVCSPEFSCFGRQWSLRLYPGGHHEWFSNNGNVSIFLRCCSGDIDVEWECSFGIKSSAGKQLAYFRDIECIDDECEEFFCVNFAKRSKIAGALVEGTLIVEVRMKLNGARAPLFVPKNPLCKHFLKKFLDEETADLLFEDSASTLYELSKSAKNMTPTQISDVKPDIFRDVLYYAYGGDVSAANINANAEEIIDAADKYGVVSLKLEAEACYAKSVKLTVDNVIDALLYAECKNCALLKEVAMDYIAENGKNVLNKVSFENVPGTMMKDLLAATTRREESHFVAMTRGKKTYRDDNDYSTMRVSTLRRKLHEKGLDVDGSREAMIALLKKNS